MPSIAIHIQLDKNLAIKAIVINHNDTKLPSGSELIVALAKAIVSSFEEMEAIDKVSDLLDDLGIEVEKPE